jgi:hypothetical protein
LQEAIEGVASARRRLAAHTAAAAAARARAAPRPLGSRTLPRRDLTGAERERVSAALTNGNPGEQLAENENIPVTRADMQTLRPGCWLNDEVTRRPSLT